MWSSIHSKIKKRILQMEPGTVFSIADFNDISVTETASKVLGRLKEEGTVEKITRGVFYRPDGEKSPQPHEIASALARGNMWDFAPSGATALYLLGVEATPPKIWTYVTDGTYREYSIGNEMIKFSHTTGKLLNQMSEKTKLLVQVLKFYGKDRISEELLESLRQKFRSGEEDSIINEAKNAPAWIVEAMRKMFKKRIGYSFG